MSRDEYRALFDAIDEAVTVVEPIFDSEGKCVDFIWGPSNSAVFRMTGLRDVEGKRAYEIVSYIEPEWLERYGRVAKTGEPERFEYPVESLGRWLSAYVSRVGGDDSHRIVVIYSDITARKLAETALRESEERQTFLLELSDEFRRLRDPEAIRAAGVRIMAEHLEVNRAVYVDLLKPERSDLMSVAHIYERDVRPWVGDLSVADYGAALGPAFVAGQTTVVTDSETEPRFADAIENYRHFQIRAAIAVPIVKDGQLVGVTGVHQAAPRDWTAREIRLVEDIAERTWEAINRAQAEMSLRASEERQRLTVELVPALLWSASSDGREVALNERWWAYTGQSETETQQYGWLGAIHPNDLPAARTDFEHAFATGEPLERQHRVRKAGDGYRWHLVRQVPVRDEHGVITRWFGAAVDIHNGKLAEEALRASEERFAQFAKASSAGIWIRDAVTLAMEYVSPAVSAIYGVGTDAFLGDINRWAAMIVPEDRAAALEHIERARQGESAVYEFRIQRPSDGTFRWIRNTDFPLELNGRVQRIGGFAEDITDQKLNVEHQTVLLAELQHRVRNIMAIIRSIVARTEEGAGSVSEYAALLSGRLLVLARVQALLTRAANAKVGLAGIVHDELSAQAAHPDQFDVSGPDVLLSPKAAETMTLAVHELTTNALKYGALSVREGVVTVCWDVVEKRDTPWLKFSWVESGAPPRAAPSGPRRVGFGSELIEGRIPYELKGRGKVVIEPGGARCDLEFPLKDGASVLETDAPQRATVFGGTIDMSGQADLSGQRVLVLEDDYYLATDTARALRGAGAEVIGPCATENDARDALDGTPPTCAVLDINLGEGRSFDLARELGDSGVPVVFITGYDEGIIPDDLAETKRLQKPVQFAEIVGALAGILGVEQQRSAST